MALTVYESRLFTRFFYFLLPSSDTLKISCGSRGLLIPSLKSQFCQIGTRTFLSVQLLNSIVPQTVLASNMGRCGTVVFNKFFPTLLAVKREPVNDAGLCNTGVGKIFILFYSNSIPGLVMVFGSVGDP
jgi:hypothetical protein